MYMKALVHEKERAIELRRRGMSYRDIMREVKVAKSSISLWLKDLPLTKNEKTYLRKRLDSNISRGRIKAATANHRHKVERDEQIIKDAQKEFQKYKDDTLFHTGISLYWAEGAKRSNAFQFVNSDADMMNVMLAWIERYTDFKRNELGYRLYIHKPYAHMEYEKVWARKLGIPASCFKRTIFKPTNLGYKKRPNYEGCLRVEVPRSTALFLKIKGWTEALIEYHIK